MLTNDEHPRNALFEIIVTDWGIIICVNEEQFLKDFVLIYFNDDGRIILLSFGQSENALFSIDSIVEKDSNITFFNDGQYLKEPCSIVIIDDGINIFSNDEHSSKINGEITFNDDGIEMLVRDEQP